MRTDEIQYEASGVAMIGHLVWDESRPGPRPAVLLFPDAGGRGENVKRRAARVAQEFGYVAMACDLWGGGEVFTDIAAVMPKLGQLRGDTAKVRALTLNAHAALAARPQVDAARIAAIGYCFGGTLSYELALTGTPIVAAIGFHGGLEVSAPQDVGRITAKVLALVGSADPLITAEHRTAFAAMMSKGTADWQMTVYGGVVHSFTDENAGRAGNPDFARYDAAADRRSWRQMADLFAETMA